MRSSQAQDLEGDLLTDQVSTVLKSFRSGKGMLQKSRTPAIRKDTRTELSTGNANRRDSIGSFVDGGREKKREQEERE